FDSTDEHGRKVGLLCQSFLAEFRLFAVSADRLSQKAAMFWSSRHNRPSREKKPLRLTMSLTTYFIFLLASSPGFCQKRDSSAELGERYAVQPPRPNRKRTWAKDSPIA